MNKLLATWIGSVAGLMMLGLLSLYSATARYEHPERFFNHLAWIGMGLAFATIAAFCPYSLLQTRKVPAVTWSIAILLLGLVLIPGIGEEINGARRWFRCGGQPAEPAKLALILAMADYGARHLSAMRQFKRGFLMPAVMVGIMAGLIFLEPDWGTAILTGLIGLAMMIAAGTRWRYISLLTLIAVIGLGILIQEHPERLRRLPILIEQSPGDRQDVWQVWHSILSFSAGGWLGTSPGMGVHKYGYVAEQETDFILSLLGEELGFLGSSAVAGLFLSMLLAGVSLAWKMHDPFAQLLVLGVTFMISLQAFINIGVVTNLLPCKGLPLPFLSYGGSNLICLMTGVGWVISAARCAPLTSLIHLPILDRIRPQTIKPELSDSVLGQKPLGFLERGLYRVCYGPHWTYWTSIQHHYQLPPQGVMIRPRSPFHRWLQSYCASQASKSSHPIRSTSQKKTHFKKTVKEWAAKSD